MTDETTTKSFPRVEDFIESVALARKAFFPAKIDTLTLERLVVDREWAKVEKIRLAAHAKLKDGRLGKSESIELLERLREIEPILAKKDFAALRTYLLKTKAGA